MVNLIRTIQQSDTVTWQIKVKKCEYFKKYQILVLEKDCVVIFV